MINLEYFDLEFTEKKFKAEYLPVLNLVSDLIQNLEPWNATQLESELKDFIKKHSIKPGELFPALRVVITGIPTGPDVFKMVEFLGREQMCTRLLNFINYINNKKLPE